MSLDRSDALILKAYIESLHTSINAFLRALELVREDTQSDRYDGLRRELAAVLPVLRLHAQELREHIAKRDREGWERRAQVKAAIDEAIA